MTARETERAAMAYWQSWQEPADWDAFRHALAEDVVFDPGGQPVAGADTLTQMLRATDSPWRDVEMLASVVGEDQACLVYEGVDRAKALRIRVAEHVRFEHGKISKVIATIAALPS